MQYGKINDPFNGKQTRCIGIKQACSAGTKQPHCAKICIRQILRMYVLFPAQQEEKMQCTNSKFNAQEKKKMPC